MYCIKEVSCPPIGRGAHTVILHFEREDGSGMTKIRLKHELPLEKARFTCLSLLNFCSEQDLRWERIPEHVTEHTGLDTLCAILRTTAKR